MMMRPQAREAREKKGMPGNASGYERKCDGTFAKANEPHSAKILMAGCEQVKQGVAA